MKPMKRTFSIIVLIFLLAISVGSFNGVRAQSDFEFEMDDFVNIGEFMEMKMSADSEGMDMIGYMRFELTGENTISVKGKSYECLVATLIGNGDISSSLGISGTFKVSGNMWMDKGTGNTVKSTFIMDMTVKYQGQSLSMKSEGITIPISSISNWTSDKDQRIGDTWKVTSTAEVTTTETSDTPDGKETDSNTETVTTVTYYERVEDRTVTTGLGTFECKVTKSYDEDDIYYSEYDYKLDYSDRNGIIPVKYETYEDGDKTMEMEITAYNFGGVSGGEEVIGPIGSKKGDDDDKESGMFGLGKVAGLDVFLIIVLIIILLIVLILAGIALRKRKKSKTGIAPPYPPREPHRAPAEQPPAYHYRESAYHERPSPRQAPESQYQDQEPIYQQRQRAPEQQYQYQEQAYQQTQPSPTAPAQSHERNSCQTCGYPLEFIEQYNRNYCNYCKEYR